MNEISDSIMYIGVYDKTLEYFENQYPVPNGITYNSYLIKDEKIAVMDTVDIRMSNDWFKNLESALNGSVPDYLVIHHMEPDHSSCISTFLEKYPNAKVVGNARTFSMIYQFFDIDIEANKVVVTEGDMLDLGKHKLNFYMAPMVHWPEVMVSFESTEKILFSADAFGTFGSSIYEEDWDKEAGRYYFNIIGKYGNQVQILLKKLAPLGISKIASLHGPLLENNISAYINKYQSWSSYEPEYSGVFIAYASIYGNTAYAAKKLAKVFENKGVKNVVLFDLARQDVSYAVDYAFRFDSVILASATHDAALFPPMEFFISHLKGRNYQKRNVGILENGSWAPAVARILTPILNSMIDIKICNKVISIKSACKNTTDEDMEAFADEMIKMQSVTPSA